MVQWHGAADPEALQHERLRLENAIQHLQRSNVELQAAIQGGDCDTELSAAVQERTLPNSCGCWLARVPHTHSIV